MWHSRRPWRRLRRWCRTSKASNTDVRDRSGSSTSIETVQSNTSSTTTNTRSSKTHFDKESRGRWSVTSTNTPRRSKRFVHPADQAVMDFLQQQCPECVLPKILAYCGPQHTQALARSSRQWRDLIQQEATWKVLCQDLYKWEPGQEEPTSWKQYYMDNPCVPVDYPSIPKALQSATPTRVQTRSLRIWLRPGIHRTHEAITMHMVPNVTICLQSMILPNNTFRTPVLPEAAPQGYTEPREGPPKGRTSRSSLQTNSVSSFTAGGPSPLTRAVLVLRGRRANEPVVRVTRGHLVLKGVEIHHNAPGADIWNGNSAIHVQPSDSLSPPSVWMEGCCVTSASGRGVVNINGGALVMKQCLVTHCAATGVYIGGAGTRAIISHTDVVHNGLGNTRSRRGGIARGHSGIYLEQGVMETRHCNVSFNTLTGISSVSPEKSILTLEHSDLFRNGTHQLELPPLGSLARRSSVLNDNRMSILDDAPVRSGLSLEWHSS